MNDASDLRKDRKKYLQRCLERGRESYNKMSPEEKKVFDDETKRIEESGEWKKMFFDVHEVRSKK